MTGSISGYSAAAALFGVDTTGGSGSAVPATLQYKLAQKSTEADFQKYANRRDVQAEIDRGIKAIRSVSSVDDLFKNYAATQFLTKALGVGSLAQTPGLLKAALLSDPNDTKSLVRKLNNNNLLNANATLKLGTTGITTLESDKTIQSLTDTYLRVGYEQTLSGGNAAVSKARYFKQNIAAASDNAYKILGDAVLRDVVSVTLGLPREIAVQPVETQAGAITRRIEINRFSDPGFTDKFIQRYLSTIDQQQQSTGQSDGGILSLFQSGGNSFNISA